MLLQVVNAAAAAAGLASLVAPEATDSENPGRLCHNQGQSLILHPADLYYCGGVTVETGLTLFSKYLLIIG